MLNSSTAAADRSVSLPSRRAAARSETVAQWRGHIDHDLLAWKAAAIGRWYHWALLVVESNTLECRGEYVLDRLSRHYRNLYLRLSSLPVRPAPGPVCRL